MQSDEVDGRKNVSVSYRDHRTDKGERKGEEDGQI